mgnify:CR=1 FL=1
MALSLLDSGAGSGDLHSAADNLLRSLGPIQHGEVEFREPRRDHKHGRIWRISFPENPPAPFTKPANMKAMALAEALLFSEENIVRELATAELRIRKPDQMLSALNSLVIKDDLHAVRRVWATQALNRLDIGLAKGLIQSKSHNARAAGLRALYYDASNKNYKDILPIAEEAVSDPSPHVRLWAVSLLAQLESPETVKIVNVTANIIIKINPNQKFGIA